LLLVEPEPIPSEIPGLSGTEEASAYHSQVSSKRLVMKMIYE